jgi:hypothetical protein
MFNVESVELGEVLYPVYEKLDEYKSYLDSDYSRKFDTCIDMTHNTILVDYVDFSKLLPQDTENYFNNFVPSSLYSNKFQSY